MLPKIYFKISKTNILQSLLIFLFLHSTPNLGSVDNKSIVVSSLSIYSSATDGLSFAIKSKYQLNPVCYF